MDDIDRRALLYEVLAETIKRFGWLCHGYCLMNNHYHLLIETPSGNLIRGMRQINGVYTQLFNRIHGQGGHLFQGRYGSVLVEKNSHLLELCRYIVLNPVRAGMVKQPGDWRWSNHRAIVEEEKKPKWLTTDWILLQFGKEREEAIKRYRRFVQDGIEAESPWKQVEGGIALGGKSFVRKIQSLIRKDETIKEIPRLQRNVGRPPLNEILERTRGTGNEQKPRIHEAYVKYGYTMKEIAQILGVHYATVSRIIRKEERGGNV